MQPASDQTMPERKLGRLQQANAQVIGAHSSGGQRIVDLDSSLQTIKGIIAETALHLETSFERRMVAMDEKVVQQFDFICKMFTDLQEKDMRMESLVAKQMERVASALTPESAMEGSMIATQAPQGDPFTLGGNSEASSNPGTPGSLNVAVVLDRTSVMPTKSKRRFLRMGTHSLMQVASIWLIICYLVFVGLSLSIGMSNAKKGHDLPGWMKFGNWIFLGAFASELAARLFLERIAFFLGENRNVNVFDFVLTVIQICEVLGLFYSRISLARVLKTIRFLQVTRTLRQMKSFRSLRLILSISVWRPLVWGAVSLIFYTFVFSLFFAQLVTDWLVAEGYKTADPALLADLEEYYGTLRKTMVSLFMAFTGGELWAVLWRPLQRVSPWCEPLFVFYILLTTCGMVKILGALFVDMVLFTSNRDHDIQMTEREQKDRELADGLKQLVQSADRQKTGRVSRDAVMRVLSKKENNKILKELGLELDMVKSLFALLDIEERNRVGIDELCYGMMNMSADSHFARNSMLMFQSKRTLDKLDFIARIVGNKFHKLEKLIIASSSCRDASHMDC